MLDLKLIREQPTWVQVQLRRRSADLDLQPILELDQQIRALENQRSQLQAESNSIGKQVGQLMAKEPQSSEIEILRQRGNQIKTQLAELEPQERELRAQIQAFLLLLPNLPDEIAPDGEDETANREVRHWGNAYKTQGEVLPHWEIAQQLGILDTERSTRLAQSRFVTLLGAGAALERALTQFMLDRHIAAGYVEVMPPLLVNSQALTGTGQLPKFAQESFHCDNDDLWLVPTAEVPVTNLYREDILEAGQLPIYHCAWTPCFRREAGSYGRDVRGLIRLHQFNKVELVKLVHPDTSAQEHEALVGNAEAILQALKLPYRVIELCTGDLGFGAARCYDLDV
ncbi:MAG: serine--tRNA ligase, partial [Gloeomargaritaceae cyanobacterium C42_A2020_066]|nr:serine--tRNA ligase [Gloeomargaritaceae cyanobacterium C42_A2020_066]